MVPFFCVTSVMVVSAMHGGEPAVMTSWMSTWGSEARLGDNLRSGRMGSSGGGLVPVAMGPRST